MRPGLLTFTTAILSVLAIVALLASHAPRLHAPPQETPFATLEAMMGQALPAGQVDCWSDWYTGWEAQMMWCWYPHYTLTIKGGRVVRVYGRGIEDVRVGDVYLRYGYPVRVQQFGTITALWYPGMVVYARGSRVVPESRVYSVSIRERS